VREVDLFDLGASQPDRRILGITLDRIDDEHLDRAFLVHQRIAWRGRHFDPDAFWNLSCGLTNRAPGPRRLWAAEGRRLIRRRVAKPRARVRVRLGVATPTIAGPEPTAVAAPASAIPVVVLQASETRTLHDAPGAWEWAPIGPNNIGGRATSFVCHPARPDVVWLRTAAGGGVWKSEDAGRFWRSLWHKQETLAVGSLAIDPANPDGLW
jgi:hypothetical protein